MSLFDAFDVHGSMTRPRPGPAAGRGRPRGPRGLSLVEVMIALAITAALLSAVAAAFSAAASATEVNDRFFRATQAGRVCLHQLLSEIRQADAITVYPLSDPVHPTELEVIRPLETRTFKAGGIMEASRYYKFHPAAGTEPPALKFRIEYVDGAFSEWYRLAGNVTGQFPPPETRLDTGSDGVPVTTVTRARVALRVTVGKEEINLSGSASPRRAQVN
jgi:prepilin-type N-terminal cleavage/methylation domain-containing protein